MSAHAPALAISTVASLLLACGGEQPAPTPPALADCSPGWQPIYGRADLLEPPALAYGEDTLLFQTVEGEVAEPNADRAVIQALTTGDGIARTLVADEASTLWVEDGTVFYTHGGLQDQLFRVPLAGGAAALVLDGGSAAPLIQSFPAGLDASYFYWTWMNELGPSSLSLWRMSRTGGSPERLAPLPGVRDKVRLALAADGVIAADSHGVTGVVPFDGSAVRLLGAMPDSLDTRLVGVDGSGSYWLHSSIPAAEPREQAPSEILQVPADGSDPRPFWPEKPPLFAPSRLWADPDGGWLVAGSEDFDDGHSHHAVWLLDPEGAGRRAACDPSVHLLDDSTQPAFSADAAYLVATYAELHTWAIVRVAR